MKLKKILTSKKAADPNQMFIYISAIVIVGFVFVYGFKSVLGFIKSSQEIELVKFIKDFQNTAKSVSAEYGSKKYISIDIPSQFEKMCILKLDEDYPQIDQTDCENSELGLEVCDAWFEYKESDSTLEKKNIFFLDERKHIGHTDVIDNIVLSSSDAQSPDGFLCTSDGKLKLVGGARVATVSLDI